MQQNSSYLKILYVDRKILKITFKLKKKKKTKKTRQTLHIFISILQRVNYTLFYKACGKRTEKHFKST